MASEDMKMEGKQQRLAQSSQSQQEMRGNAGNSIQSAATTAQQQQQHIHATRAPNNEADGTMEEDEEDGEYPTNKYNG